MKNKDQILLEQEYEKVIQNPIVRNPNGVQGFGTKLRPNYSFSQISDKRDWIKDMDERFQDIKLEFPDFNSWKAILKYANQTINIESQGQDVFVDGNKLTPEERLSLRKYIKVHYGHHMANPRELRNPIAFNGKGEPV